MLKLSIAKALIMILLPFAFLACDNGDYRLCDSDDGDPFNDGDNYCPFFRNSDGSVTDSRGVTCESDHNDWADCYPEIYQSKCKDGKAIICGNTFTSFEVFEYHCNCQMLNGKATCGECRPGDINEKDNKICNPAGLWETLRFKLIHPDDQKPCDPQTYRSKCVDNFAFECNSLNRKIDVADCNNNTYAFNTCVEYEYKSSEAEFNQYTLMCEKDVHRASCKACKPGQEAKPETVCLSGHTRNATTVVCNEFGNWEDKATGELPERAACDTACSQGRCLGKYVPCTEDAPNGNVCYTEDTLSRTPLSCNNYGKWFNMNSPLDLEYCEKGCINNICYH